MNSTQELRLQPVDDTPMTLHGQPPVLEYQPRNDDSPFWRRIRWSLVAGTLVGIAGAIGFLLDQQHPGRGSPLVLPICFGGAWYVAARVKESQRLAPVKVVKLIAGLASLGFAVRLASDELSITRYAEAYGWTSRQAFGWPTVVALVISLGVVTVADVCGWLTGLLREKWLREGDRTGTHSPPRSAT